MIPSEKLLAHLENILPRRDWEQQRSSITKMVKAVYEDGWHDGLWSEQQHKENKPTDAKP